MRKLATAVAVSLALASTGAKALGLGEIEMHSALNQPLDAEILLNSVGPGELDGLLVQLASREAFERAGIERAQALSDLRFTVDKKSDGTPYIKIGSSSPVVEPFLNFLLEVDWQKGRMIREYTILLDPPVFMNQDAVSSGVNAQAPEALAQTVAEQDLAVPVAIERAGEPLPEIDVVIEDEIVDVADDEYVDVTDEYVVNDIADFDAGEEVVIESIEIEDDVPTITADTVATGSEEVFLLDGVRTTSTDIPLAETYPLEGESPVSTTVVEERYSDSASDYSTATRYDSDGAPEVLMVGDNVEVGNEPGEVVSSSYSSAGNDYTVQRNDTLWDIATANRPSDVSVQQMMIALLRANQNAFVDNNANRLKAGAILRMPADAEIRAVSRGEAVAEMTEQNRLWQQYRNTFAGSAATTVPAAETADTSATSAGSTPAESGVEETQSERDTAADTSTAETTAGQSTGGELNIVAEPDSTETDASMNQDSADASDNAVVARVSTDIALAQEELAAERLQKEELLAQAEDLTQTNEQMERLIELRENELAQLQSQLAEQGGEMPLVDPETDIEAEAEADTEAGTTVETIEPPVTQVQPIADQPEPGFFEKLLKDPMKLIAGLGAALLALLAGWWFLRRRREDDGEVVFEASEDDLYEDDVYDDVHDDHEHMAAAGASDDDADTVYATDAGAADATADIMDDTDRDGLDSEDFLEHAVDDEIAKDDTISEADVYLAYGLHGQAEDILTKAVDRDPENEGYYVKLLETYHGQKNAERFDEVAGQFHARFGGSSNPAWARIAEMGAELNPDNDTYKGDGGSSAGVVAAAGAAGAAGLGALAGMLDKEPAADSTLASDEVYDETSDTTQIIAPPGESAALSEPEEESLLDQSIDPGFSFDEADLEATGDFSKIAAEVSDEIPEVASPAAPAASDDDSGLDFGSLKDAAADKASTVGAAGAGLAAAVAGAVGLGGAKDKDDADQGIDFDTTTGFSEDGEYGNLSGDPEQIADSANSGLDGLLDEIADGQGSEGSTRVIGENLVGGAADAAQELAADTGDAIDAGLDFDESVLDLSSLDAGNGAADDDLELAGTSEELTLDLDQLSLDDDQGESVDSLFDHTETLDTAFDQTQELEIPDLTANADLTASDDSSAFGSTNEMETILDLAKAYIDMGDNESASSALSEIIKSGNEEQKSMAQELMKKIS
ncbi:FimV/HubP family polar landmark protein [Granulosicoccaceae sp. 1_MG-2023]|nr:FimV/HubP family polar landmark protein [Granulosicoccaceae sp. 1_MG-2023]